MEKQWTEEEIAAGVRQYLADLRQDPSFGKIFIHPDADLLRQYHGENVVYCFRSLVNGKFKIGVSNNVARRIESLSRWIRIPKEQLRFVWANRYPTYNHAMVGERTWHARFEEYRVRRTEWFDLPPEIIERFTGGTIPLIVTATLSTAGGVTLRG